MDTFKLKAILRAVETGSMTKAAKEFSYTPSALSHSIDSLEKELSVKLLERSPKGVAFSESGKRLEPKLRAIIKAENELFEGAKELSERSKNVL